MSANNYLPLSPTERSTVRRYSDRAAKDRQSLYDILDAGLVCHVAFVIDGAPVILPSVYGRESDTIFIHASSAARLPTQFGIGVPVCVAVTHLDAIVYARDVYHNSVNYRSAVIHANGVLLQTDEQKLKGLRAMADHMAPGAWDYGDPPPPKELARVAVMAVDLRDASVKIRDAPPSDHGNVSEPNKWAGLLPVRTAFGTPQPDGHVGEGTEVPPHIANRIF